MSAIKNYFKTLIALHKAVVIWPLNKTLHSKIPRIAVFAANTIFFLKKKSLHINFNEENKLFFIKDGAQTHWFGDLVRGYNLYVNGLQNRSKKLFNSYLLNEINFENEDVVIDCGANYADLWLGLKSKIKGENYITFEPGIREHASIIRNAPNGIHNSLGLSNKEGLSKYFVNEKAADSSVIEPSNYSHVVEIDTTTLNKYVSENALENIKLFKLEAEGFEPEILEGALEVLNKIQYIAVDGGYERGKEQTETFSALCNTLHDHNFEIVSINFEWARALFYRKA